MCVCIHIHIQIINCIYTYIYEHRITVKKKPENRSKDIYIKVNMCNKTEEERREWVLKDNSTNKITDGI